MNDKANEAAIAALEGTGLLEGDEARSATTAAVSAYLAACEAEGWRYVRGKLVEDWWHPKYYGPDWRKSHAVKATLEHMEAEGFVMVPVEATERMIDAGFDHHPKHFEAKMGRPPTPEEDLAWQWRAMIAARPDA